MGAKHEFTQQIFTKTMSLQIWKPEHERAGRHFVYTSRYVLFFVGLLNQLNDRVNLDLLLKRIRRKPNDYLNHTKVWGEVCVTYIRVSSLRAPGESSAYLFCSFFDAWVKFQKAMKIQSSKPLATKILLLAPLDSKAGPIFQVPQLPQSPTSCVTQLS